MSVTIHVHVSMCMAHIIYEPHKELSSINRSFFPSSLRPPGGEICWGWCIHNFNRGSQWSIGKHLVVISDYHCVHLSFVGAQRCGGVRGEG